MQSIGSLIHSFLKRNPAGKKQAGAFQLPVFSVVIPVYDRTDLLREAILSVLNQSCSDFELILVCDGSPPETLEVVESFRDQARVRIRIFSGNSGNACRGRNTGIEMARGQYIALLDSDDLAMPNRLQLTLDAFESMGADVVFGGAKFIVDGSRTIDGISDGQIVIPEPFDMEKAKESNPILTCTVCVRTECLRLHGAFRPEMRYREDHELWLRLAHKGCRFVRLDKVLSAYRLHSGNAELSFLPDDEHWKTRMLELYRQ